MQPAPWRTSRTPRTPAIVDREPARLARGEPPPWRPRERHVRQIRKALLENPAQRLLVPSADHHEHERAVSSCAHEVLGIDNDYLVSQSLVDYGVDGGLGDRLQASIRKWVPRCYRRGPVTLAELLLALDVVERYRRRHQGADDRREPSTVSLPAAYPNEPAVHYVRRSHRRRRRGCRRSHAAQSSRPGSRPSGARDQDDGRASRVRPLPRPLGGHGG